MKIKEVIILLLLACLSCDGDDSNASRDEETNLNLITGISAVTDEFSEPLLLGNPNEFNGNLKVYPNPVINSFVIKSTFNSSITDVWIIKGSPEKKFQNEDFSEVLNSSLYAESELLTNSELNLSELNGENLSINLGGEGLSMGYYKVFVKVDGEIFWANIYFGNDKDIIELTNFWN